jgi:phage terminase large subunit GpA-like protein
MKSKAQSPKSKVPEPSEAAQSATRNSQSDFITELFFKAIRIAIPDANLTVSQCADKYRFLSPERSARPGKWSTDVVPYLRGIMDACSDPEITRVIFVKPNQVGGTEAANNLILHRMFARPGKVLYACETEDKSKAWSTESLETMIRDTPVLANLIKEKRTRDSGNTIKAKKFPGGHLALGWATSPSTGSSRPRDTVILDEFDAFEPTKEGNYGEIATLRMDTFDEPLVFITSTPRNRLENPPGTPIDAPRFSPIEREYEESDKRRYFVPCLKCGTFQYLKWDHVRWGDDPLNPWYECDKCNKEIEEDDKPEMLAEGDWKAEKECFGIAGFHLNKLYSPFPNATWRHVVASFLKAKRSGDPNQLKVWVNTSAAEGWQDDDTKVETKTLRERREHYFGIVPRGVLLLTAGVDVQINRLELAIWGWGLNNECWAIDHVLIEGDPLHAETWNKLKLELLRKFAYEDGGELRIMATVIDTGFMPDQVRRFCRDNSGLRVIAGKGSSSHTAPLVSKPSLWGKPAIKLYSLGTNAAKDIIYAGLRVPEPGPGYVHFPIDQTKFDEAYFRQILSEKKITVKSGRKLVRAYEPLKPGMRNEALDTWVYARCALAIVNPNLVWLAGEFAKRVSGVRDQVSGENEPPLTGTADAPVRPVTPEAAGEGARGPSEEVDADTRAPAPDTRRRRRGRNFGTRF